MATTWAVLLLAMAAAASAAPPVPATAAAPSPAAGGSTPATPVPATPTQTPAPAPDADALANRRAVGEANNEFAAALYQTLRSQPGNLVVSPFSAGAVLALALMGAGGQTAEELRTALRLPQDLTRVSSGYRQLFDSLQSTDEMILRVANKAYLQNGFRIKEPFRRTAVDDFRAGAEELDFAGRTEESRLAINGWVENVTDSKIRDLLAQGTLDSNTLMVLVNAIYFKGSWVKTFDESLTRPDTFHLPGGERLQVPMMHQSSRFGHGRLADLQTSVLEMPYRGGNLKMLILLPDAVDGLERLEAGLPQINFTRLSNEISYGEVIVTLPKFKIESKFALHENLPELGVRALFSPGADLSGITDQSVVVSQVVQKAFVEVNERGTVAAAATALVGVPYAAVFPRPPVFTADRPFLFAIVDVGHSALFLGRVALPGGAAAHSPLA